MNLDSPRKLAVAIAVGTVLVSLAAWFLLVSPKRDDASRLAAEVASERAELAKQRAELTAAQHSDLPSLAVLHRAIPSKESIATAVRELDGFSRESGVSVWTVTPGVPVAASGFLKTPMTVQVEGRFSEISALLATLRRLVTVEKDTLRTDGRLYTIDSIEIGAGTPTFPQLKASMQMNVYHRGDGTATPAASS